MDWLPPVSFLLYESFLISLQKPKAWTQMVNVVIESLIDPIIPCRLPRGTSQDADWPINIESMEILSWTAHSNQHKSRGEQLRGSVPEHVVPMVPNCP